MNAFSVYFKFAHYMFVCRVMFNLEPGVSLLTVTILLLLGHLSNDVNCLNSMQLDAKLTSQTTTCTSLCVCYVYSCVCLLRKCCLIQTEASDQSDRASPLPLKSH